jgi:hypothetical protein
MAIPKKLTEKFKLGLQTMVKLDRRVMTDDERAAFDLLRGRRQKSKTNYLKGAEEKQARAALVRVLKDIDRPLHLLLRLNLANLFESSSHPSRRGRRLIFKNRYEGNWQKDREGNFLVFWYVDRLMKGGEPLKAAVEDAGKHFRLSTSQIHRKYNAHIAPSR